MSILLEALKKSEERRQLGKTPDIHDPPDHRLPEDDKPGFPWLPSILVAAAMAAIFGFVWIQYRAPDAAAVSSSPEISERREPGKTGQPLNGQAGTDVSASDGQPQQPAAAARTPVDSFTAAEGEKDGQTAQGQDPEAGRKQQLAQNFNNFRQPEDAQAATDAEPENVTVPAAEPRPTRPAQPQPRQTAAAGQPRESGPVSYWELPQNVRDEMPEFRISVLVYAENPADRFMLLNGRRMVEKDSVNGLELEEIQRDGAVFRYRNYRFLVRD